MAVFTCIYSWDDNDYTCQVECPSIDDVLKAWFNQLTVSVFDSWHGSYNTAEKHKSELGKDIYELGEKPVAINNNINVWLATFIFSDKLGELTIIKTDVSVN